MGSSSSKTKPARAELEAPGTDAFGYLSSRFDYSKYQARADTPIDYQAEVVRRSQYAARARSPPRRNHGSVVTPDERERRAEEDFSWIGSFDATPSPPRPIAMSFVRSVSNDSRLEDHTTHGEREIKKDEIRRPNQSVISDEVDGTRNAALDERPVQSSRPSHRILCCFWAQYSSL